MEMCFHLDSSAETSRGMAENSRRKFPPSPCKSLPDYKVRRVHMPVLVDGGQLLVFVY